MAKSKQVTGPTLATSLHIKSLIAVFVTWKTLLLCVACVSPGVGYDTSTQLLFPSASANDLTTAVVIRHVSSRLVRWDALYFIRVAERNCLFEQEWAFSSWGFTRLVAIVAKVCLPALSVPSLLRETLAGVLVAHVSHFFSVLLLFALTKSIIPSHDSQRERAAVIAGVLHILSPAGIFLSAPYSESLFSCLNFLGMLLYSHSYPARSERTSNIHTSVAILGSGLCWGLAASVRGNGILSGIILAYRCLTLVPQLASFAAFQILVVTIAAGLMVALGSILPQWSAYQEYCMDSAFDESPVWCSRLPPSVYTYVQEHYWNVGFLRYWTLSNAPLFLLAIPVLCLMLATAHIAIFHPSILLSRQSNAEVTRTKHQASSAISEDDHRFIACLRSFALPQAVLTLLTLANFHVQIINRISSGYPIMSIVLAMALTSREPYPTTGGPPGSFGTGTLLSCFRKRGVQLWIFYGTFLYALIQCGLYASFLPPA